MSQSLEGILEEQRRALVAESAVSGAPPIVAVMSIEQLIDKALVMSRAAPPATLSPLIAGTPTRAYVQVSPTYKSMWAATGNDGYRQDYACFLRDHHGLPVDTLPTTYDVDHLYNRERARQYGYGYIRMFLVRRGPNRSHGGGFEKAITAAEKDHRAKIMKLLDEVSLMKLMEVNSPRKGKALTVLQEAHLQWAAQTYGLPLETLRTNIDGLMARAHG